MLIGIVTVQAADIEQRQLLEGIIRQAQTLGMDTAVFSNIYNSEEYFAGIEAENRIYDMIGHEQLDGLILSAESIRNRQLLREICERIARRQDIPVIVTGAEIAGMECLNNDVRTDTRIIVDHLIEAHGLTDIDFLTGFAELETSHLRVAGYRDALAAHGLPYEEGKVVFGNYWTDSGEALAAEYISGRRHLPQAVACANDHMAYGLCDRLVAHGVRIPEEVAVTGYEYVGERFYHTPILTTYRRSRQALGARAVLMLWSRITGQEAVLPPVTGEVIPGGSCPCGADTAQLAAELAAVRREQLYSRMNLVGSFEQQLTTCRSMGDYVSVLQQFAYLIRDVRGLYLCLDENWSSLGEATGTMVCYPILSPVPVSGEPVLYPAAKELPPAIAPTGHGLVLYFCPIFFSGRFFGHFVLQYDGADGYDIIFRDWLKIASNALEMLRMKNDISSLLEIRSLSVLRDSVTGLYSAAGLRTQLRAMGERPLQMIVLRTDIFSDSIRIDLQSSVVGMEQETAGILQDSADTVGGCAGKLGDRTYALLLPGTPEHAALTADRLTALIVNAPLYSRYCTHDSVLTAHCTAEDFDAACRELTETLSRRLWSLSQMRRHAYYARYARIRERIYAEPGGEYRAGQLCRELGQSEGYFRAMYRELFGISLHQDLIASRILLAKALILAGTMGFSAIAQRCGYHDEKHFFHQFRRVTGMSPKQYRSE